MSASTRWPSAAEASGVENHIADVVIGLVILRGNVDGVARQHFVQAAQHARQIALYLDEPRARWPRRQLDLGEIDRAHRRAGIAVVDQLAGHFGADAFLRLFGRTADVRRQDDVFQALQRRHEAIRIRARLDRKNVDRGATKPAFAQRVGERLEVDDRTAAVVDEIRARLDRRNLLAPDHPMRGRCFRHMQRSRRRFAPTAHASSRPARCCHGEACRCDRRR